MDNNVKFNIDLQVLGMPQVQNATAAVKAMGTLVSDFSALTSPLANIGKILETISLKIDKLGNVGKKSLDKVDSEAKEAADGIKKVGDAAEKAGKKTKESFFDLLAGDSFKFNNIIGAVQNVAGMIAPIFDVGMSRETAAVQFGTLLSKEGRDGGEYAKALRDMDASKLYGTDTINQGAMKMISFGFDSNTTLKTLGQLGDIAMGDKVKLDSMATAFGQIKSAGRMMTEDFNQLRDAGFNPLKVISDATGESMISLRDKMEKGQISAEMVAQSLEMATGAGGQFHGMLNSVMENTTQGRVAKLQTAFDDLKDKLFQLALPLVDKLMPIVSKLFPLVEKFIPVISGILSVLEPVADWIAENIDQIFTIGTAIGVVAGAIALCTSPITGIVLAIGALVYALVNVMKYWDEWGKYVVLICPPLATVMNIIMSLKQHWDSIVDGFTNGGILEGLKRIGLTIIDALLAPVQNLLELIAKIPGVGKIASAIGGSVQNLRDKINNMLPEPEKKEEGKPKPGNSTQSALEAAVSPGTQGAQALASATGAGTSSVASGGTRNTQITINLGNMVESINFQGGVQENKESLTSQLEETLLRVLYSAQMAV